MITIVSRARETSAEFETMVDRSNKVLKKTRHASDSGRALNARITSLAAMMRVEPRKVRGLVRHGVSISLQNELPGNITHRLIRMQSLSPGAVQSGDETSASPSLPRTVHLKPVEKCETTC